MDIDKHVPVPIDVKNKKAYADLEALLDAEIKRLWGATVADYKNRLSFVEWLCVVSVNVNKKLLEPEQKVFINKLAIRVLGLNAQEQVRFASDVDYIFEKGLARKPSMLGRIVQFILRFL